MNSALLLVDVQNDFMPGGALAVSDGDKIVPVLNRLLPKFERVLATQDWHPANHGSFAANHPGHKPGEVIGLNGLQQILWPVHCVQNSRGARLHQDLNRAAIKRVFQKGMDPQTDSYSGFYDNGHKNPSGLADYLKEMSVSKIYIGGLATDYCVMFTALDARAEGFDVFLIKDACRAVNLKPTDEQAALVKMEQAGCQLIDSSLLRS